VRRALPRTTIELLVSGFLQGKLGRPWRRDGRPGRIISTNNIEKTVPGFTGSCDPRGSTQRFLEMLQGGMREGGLGTIWLNGGAGEGTEKGWTFSANLHQHRVDISSRSAVTSHQARPAGERFVSPRAVPGLPDSMAENRAGGFLQWSAPPLTVASYHAGEVRR